MGDDVGEHLADSVDLPDPETPVTAVSTPSGSTTSASRRLCRLIPDSRSSDDGCRRARSTAGRSARKRRVTDSSTSARPATGPL